ncbi:MAG TPA: hypothetical protein PKC41_00965 [Chitinophagaceae bacterium]|jgi:hypothetical protein|nr:hypothetical protein [Chitinophagaceae bacterium]
MKNQINDIQDWSDYWNRFEMLCDIFTRSNRHQIKDDFMEAQSNVNGMTDGWFEFVIRLEKYINKHKFNLNKDELETANFLLNYVKSPLSRY